MTVFLRLRSCARNRNYDITQHQLTAVRVKTVISPLPVSRKSNEAGEG